MNGFFRFGFFLGEAAFFTVLPVGYKLAVCIIEAVRLDYPIIM
jgi:hypothetical protein